jgi:hypothetical protein
MTSPDSGALAQCALARQQRLLPRCRPNAAASIASKTALREHLQQQCDSEFAKVSTAVSQCLQDPAESRNVRPPFEFRAPAVPLQHAGGIQNLSAPSPPWQVRNLEAEARALIQRSRHTAGKLMRNTASQRLEEARGFSSTTPTTTLLKSGSGAAGTKALPSAASPAGR